MAVAVDDTITATVLSVRMVDRYALGSLCSRTTRCALRFPSSARLRMRMRLTLVSDVSAAAANAATTSPATRMAMSGVMPAAIGVVVARPGRPCRGGLTRSTEQLAHAAALVHPHDRFRDERSHREDTKLGRIVEAGLPVGKRDGVGDADLVDRCVVQEAQCAVGEHAVRRHAVDAGPALLAQCDGCADERGPG